jgi:hypothetical protein
LEDESVVEFGFEIDSADCRRSMSVCCAHPSRFPSLLCSALP